MLCTSIGSSGIVDTVNGFILEIKIHEYNGNDVIDDLQKLGLKYVPGEVFEDDTILIEIEKEQSEKFKNQNPLHLVASMQNVQLLMQASPMVWYGRRWAVHTPFLKTFCKLLLLEMF